MGVILHKGSFTKSVHYISMAIVGNIWHQCDYINISRITQKSKHSNTEYYTESSHVTNKDSDSYDYCGGVDDILHFLKKCPNVNDFWSYWINWQENLSEIAIKNSPVLEECIIFGCH